MSRLHRRQIDAAALFASLVPAVTFVTFNVTHGRGYLRLLPGAIGALLVWTATLSTVGGLINSGLHGKRFRIILAAISLWTWAHCSFYVRLGGDGLGILDLIGEPLVLGLVARVIRRRSEPRRLPTWYSYTDE